MLRFIKKLYTKKWSLVKTRRIGKLFLLSVNTKIMNMDLLGGFMDNLNDQQIIEQIKYRIFSQNEGQQFYKRRLNSLFRDGVQNIVDYIANQLYLRKLNRIQNLDKDVKSERVENEIDNPKITYTLTSVFPSKEIQDMVMEYIHQLDKIELENREKELFAVYLGINKEEMVKYSWEEIDQMILAKYRNSISSRIKLNINRRRVK